MRSPNTFSNAWVQDLRIFTVHSDISVGLIKKKNDDFVIEQEIKLNLEISELNLVTENNTSIDAS